VSGVLVDSNILLDVMTEDRKWFHWSADALMRCAEHQTLIINPVIYAEVSIRFEKIEELEEELLAAGMQSEAADVFAAMLAEDKKQENPAAGEERSDERKREL